MNPRPVELADVDVTGGRLVKFCAPPGMPDCADVDVLASVDAHGRPVISIPFRPSAEDLAVLGAGGTVWLALWGDTMPPVSVEVYP